MGSKPRKPGPAEKRRDAALGMHRDITRRDFLYAMPALAGLLAACRTTGGRAPASPAGAPPVSPNAAGAGASAGAGAADPFAQGPEGEFVIPADWYGPGGVGDY